MYFWIRFYIDWSRKILVKYSTLKEKMESVWPKKLSHLAELKFDPLFRVIGEYLSQIDSILRVKLSIWLQWLKFLGQNDSIFSFSERQIGCRVMQISFIYKIYILKNLLNFNQVPNFDSSVIHVHRHTKRILYNNKRFPMIKNNFIVML